MALANVAFLAAMNGKRVLVMDWDLEAPGLHYYFRGMQDASVARELRAAPGVLDLVWDWSVSVQEANSKKDLDALLEAYARGLPFQNVARSLLPDFDDDPQIGLLHHIGAGAETIASADWRPYEDALAHFDWSIFFSERAGGLMLNALRNWAKQNYDYVFLDSRTGFADVAGICTMQIPDKVALCYIYNRQNIDGIAQVAGAIRARRSDEVALRAVPMRTARQDTSEEADARARARKELTRKGGFTAEAVEFDQKQLAIQAAPNVPFYETISLITSDRNRSDRLSLDYLNLANDLLGEHFEIPALWQEWVERVRRRLEPRTATSDYLIGLRSKEPQRALEELSHLVESALDDPPELASEHDYLVGLIATVAHTIRNGDITFEMENLASITLDLVRYLAATDPEQWNATFADFAVFYLEQMSHYLEQDDELLLLDEADLALSRVEGDDAKMRRLNNRRRAARIHIGENHTETATQLIAELQRIIASLDGRITGDARLAIVASNIDIAMLRGDIQDLLGKGEAARRLYENAIKLSTDEDARARAELTRLRFDLHLRLARMIPPAVTTGQAAGHALAALDWTAGFNGYIYHIFDLGDVVLRAEDAGMLMEFSRKALRPSERRPNQLSSFFGRSPRGALKAIAFIHRAVRFLAREKRLDREILGLLSDTALIILDVVLKRKGTTIGSARRELVAEVDAFASSLSMIPVMDDNFISMLRRMAQEMAARQHRKHE